METRGKSAKEHLVKTYKGSKADDKMYAAQAPVLSEENTLLGNLVVRRSKENGVV